MSLYGYKKKSKPALWTQAAGGLKPNGFAIDVSKINSAGLAKEMSRPHTTKERIHLKAEYKKLGLPCYLNPSSGRIEPIHGVAVLSPPSAKLFRPKRLRIRRCFKKRTKESELYRIEAREFVRAAIEAGGRCPVVAAVKELRDGRKYGHPISDKLNEVHHMRGRLGSLLRDQRFWIALSKQGHRWVHEHHAEARRLGFLCQPGEWNVPVPEAAP